MLKKSTFRYRIKSTGDSSAKYGKCEVCGKHASEVFYQVEEMAFADDNGQTAWTQWKCKNLFGHEKCLIGKRKQ